MKHCIILTTCPDIESAKKLAAMLVKAKLAACVQLCPITSFYCWEDELHIEPEIRLIIKTKALLYKSVEAFIKEHHSYDTPQIIQTPIDKGSTEYLAWIDDNTIDE